MTKTKKRNQSINSDLKIAVGRRRASVKNRLEKQEELCIYYVHQSSPRSNRFSIWRTELGHFKKSREERFQGMIPRHKRHFYNSEGLEWGRQYEFNNLPRNSSVGTVNAGMKPLIAPSGRSRKVQLLTWREQRGRQDGKSKCFQSVYVALVQGAEFWAASNPVDEINLEETDFARGLRKFFLSPPDIQLIKDLAHHLESGRKRSEMCGSVVSPRASGSLVLTTKTCARCPVIFFEAAGKWHTTEVNCIQMKALKRQIVKCSLHSPFITFWFMF